jgi:hypothetical protein
VSAAVVAQAMVMAHFFVAETVCMSLARIPGKVAVKHSRSWLIVRAEASVRRAQR